MTLYTRLNKMVLGTLCALFFMPATAWSDTIVVFAASSLKTALDEVTVGFAAATEHKAVVSLAGSSALARQIQLGAPADVYISANAGWMDVLEADNLVTPHTRLNLVGNKLVLVAPADEAAPLDLNTSGSVAKRLGDRPLAMALIKAVPAGIYGKQALENLQQWQGISAQVAQTDNVRAALALVAMGEAPLGVVYASDAQADPRVAVVADIPATSHAPIVYPAAAIMGGNDAASRAFLRYLRSGDAQAAFAAQGFLAVGG